MSDAIRGSEGHIPFNRPPVVGTELRYVEEALARAHVSSGGHFTRLCERWLEVETGAARAILTHSCTAALEMTALLLDVGPGDEVVMPSFTFVSTANAFVLRGATPVFVDVLPETLNLDPAAVEAALTPQTRAVVPVHYAGVPADVDALAAVLDLSEVAIIEDAAQALTSRYRSRPAGSLGSMAAVSFHETKNVVSGEGGALLLSDAELVARAEVLRDKGTNRSRFLAGQVDKYTWVDVGSSYGLSELNAAFLWAQLERAHDLIRDRRSLWARYHEALEPLESAGVLRRPAVPRDVVHNAHIYYVLAPTPEVRNVLLRGLNRHGVNAVFHYVPLDSSPAGERFGRAGGDLSVTRSVAERLVRLPLWDGIGEDGVDRVVEAVQATLGR